MVLEFLNNFFAEVIATILIAICVFLIKLLRESLMTFRQSQKEQEAVWWSPNGKRACYVSEQKGKGAISVFNATTGAEKVLDTDIVPAQKPKWSPDSAWIAFVSEKDGNREIYVAEAESGQIYRVTHDPLANVEPHWSPDGRFLYYFTIGKNGKRRLTFKEFHGVDIVAKQSC